MSAGIYIPGVYTPPGGTIGVWPWSELDKLDQRRGLDSSNIFPELYKYKDTEPK